MFAVAPDPSTHIAPSVFPTAYTGLSVDVLYTIAPCTLDAAVLIAFAMAFKAASVAHFGRNIPWTVTAPANVESWLSSRVKAKLLFE